MTKISATSILASKDSRGNRIDTMLVTFPRFLLAELNTHRLFSRNSASSRAIPFEKMVQSVEENPFIPIAWQKDHKGMQGTEYVNTGTTVFDADFIWKNASKEAIKYAKELNSRKITKQLCNRLLEPFMWHTVLITSTEWDNFFNLRCPQYGNDEQGYYKSKKEALKELQSKGVDISKLIKSSDIEWLKINKGQSEIHMMALAEAIYDCRNEAIVQKLKDGEWHIPFINEISIFDLMSKNEIYDYDNNNKDFLLEVKSVIERKIKISVARCARVSYTIVGTDSNSTIENDLKLHDRLLESGHWSPFEHIAQCMTELEYYSFIKGKVPMNINSNGDINNRAFYCTGDWKTLPEPDRFGWCNNFKAFIQYRYKLENNIKL